MEKITRILFKAYNRTKKYSNYVSIHSHLNRHILSDNIEKVEEEELTNVPPPSRGFLTNSPLPGPTEAYWGWARLELTT